MRVRRGAVTDVLTRDGETAVLVGGQVVRLSALSSAVWGHTEQWVDIAALSEALAASFGEPADRSALDATKDAVADLARHGILRVSAD